MPRIRMGSEKLLREKVRRKRCKLSIGGGKPTRKIETTVKMISKSPSKEASIRNPNPRRKINRSRKSSNL